jgi:hypothetical protein
MLMLIGGVMFCGIGSVNDSFFFLVSPSLSLGPLRVESSNRREPIDALTTGPRVRGDRVLV